ncbi:Bgt-51651 [Blumeria graminis f. sp. tritici]|uniref:Bgt-51651 n=1 Tax=Blumeria graminis f. sp. tritici TaxID=62690 RepID=A0A9X9MJV7_BLUGR|nr:Bgt-51651 [Blumeria graminis f. sp. tritici]
MQSIAFRDTQATLDGGC